MNKPETGEFLETDLITLHHRDLTKNLLPSSQCQLGKTLVTPFYGDLRLGKVVPKFYFEQEFWYHQAGQSHQLSPGRKHRGFDEVLASGKLVYQITNSSL